MMIHCLYRRPHGRFCGQFPAGVGIAVKAWEVAAGNFQPDTVPGFKDVAGRPEVDGVLIDPPGFDWL